MITLKTITTIELSSICNLACNYCINRLLVKHPARQPGIMTDEIFDRSLFWIKKLVDYGTQKEVNINGNGETLLDPQLIGRIKKLREAVGDRIWIQFCSNGVAMTRELAFKLANCGLNRIDISLHDSYSSRKAIHWLIEAGHNVGASYGAQTCSHNWAGQLEPQHRVNVYIRNDCIPLIEGRGYIQSEGYVTPCCYDYRNLGIFGHVNDSNLLDHEIKPYELCETCHQKLPEYLNKQYESEQKLYAVSNIG